MRPLRSVSSTVVALALGFSTGVSAPSAQTQAGAKSLAIQQLEPGLDFGVARLDGPEAAVKVSAVRVNLRNHRVGLAVAAYGENGKTLSEFQRLTAAKAALSGGFMTSFLPPIPLGFVKQNGVVINRAASGDLLTGVLALKNGRPTIKPWSRFEAAQWDGCLQSGPLLSEDGRSVLPTSTALQLSTRNLIDKLHVRAAVVLADDVFVMLVTEAVSLPALVSFVTREFGPRASALNLSGANSAGLVVAAGSRRETAGRGTLSLSNAIIVDGTKR
jgi:hypothetical protein